MHDYTYGQINKFKNEKGKYMSHFNGSDILIKAE